MKAEPFPFEPAGMTKIIVLVYEHSVYQEFYKRGIFLGNRDQLADMFPFLNEYDDGEIERLAKSLGCRATFYHVPNENVAAFCHDYGDGPEPTEYETKDRIVFITEGEGRDAPSRPTLIQGRVA